MIRCAMRLTKTNNQISASVYIVLYTMSFPQCATDNITVTVNEYPSCGCVVCFIEQSEFMLLQNYS